MKKSTIVFVSFLLMGFMLPYDNNSHIVATDLRNQVDGPYVLYQKDKVFANYILDSNGKKWVQTDTANVTGKRNLFLHINTDIPGQTFSVQLKDQLQNEKNEFKDVSKLLALSDIEGDFSSFSQLLQAGGVIDENFNWTFGDGHLVLTGDFLDRGQQVTEVLWLIYSLEEKAKAAGGYVHFILGNHEIMIMSSNLKYVNQKYLDNARLMNKSYESLYDQNSEIGRWLGTKNIVEKIGKLLFVHGGISDEVNNLNIPISRINQLARPYYFNSRYEFLDRITSAILSTKVGPFWYRGYYMGDERATPRQINKTLSNFDVKEIITGHTRIADTISVCYSGKIINLDSHDSHGKPEALLIDGEKYYRINPEGKKTLRIE